VMLALRFSLACPTLVAVSHVPSVQRHADDDVADLAWQAIGVLQHVRLLAARTLRGRKRCLIVVLPPALHPASPLPFFLLQRHGYTSVSPQDDEGDVRNIGRVQAALAQLSAPEEKYCGSGSDALQPEVVRPPADLLPLPGSIADAVVSALEVAARSPCDADAAAEPGESGNAGGGAGGGGGGGGGRGPAAGAPWKRRRAALQFALVFGARCLLSLPPVVDSRLRALAERCLSDPQLQVQQAASATLTAWLSSQVEGQATGEVVSVRRACVRG
jgi:hypothetical protein